MARIDWFYLGIGIVGFFVALGIGGLVYQGLSTAQSVKEAATRFTALDSDARSAFESAKAVVEKCAVLTKDENACIDRLPAIPSEYLPMQCRNPEESGEDTARIAQVGIKVWTYECVASWVRQKGAAF